MSQQPEMTTYELPDFIMESGHYHSGDYSISDISRHVKMLSAQQYALTILEMFEAIPDLVSLSVGMEKDGYLQLREFEADDEDAEDDTEMRDRIEDHLENLNDLRDDLILGFIEALFEEDAYGNRELDANSIHQTIGSAYREVAFRSTDLSWDELMQKRKAFLEAQALDGTTPSSISKTKSKPRI